MVQILDLMVNNGVFFVGVLIIAGLLGAVVALFELAFDDKK